MGEISFLRGVPAEEALEAVAGIVEKNYVAALREYGTKLLQYQTPGVSDFNGFIPLKKTLAARYGIGGDPNRRVVCFNGGMEVLSIIMKAFPRGSQVAMEAMTYDRALADALRYEHEVVGIPLSKEGVDLDALETALSSGKVKLFYRIIYHQNPTGLDSTMENIEAAAKLCARYNTLYVCDIAYYELRYDGLKHVCRIWQTPPRVSSVRLPRPSPRGPSAGSGFSPRMWWTWSRRLSPIRGSIPTTPPRP